MVPGRVSVGKPLKKDAMLVLENGNAKLSDEMKLAHNKKKKKLGNPSERSVQSKSEAGIMKVKLDL